MSKPMTRDEAEIARFVAEHLYDEGHFPFTSDDEEPVLMAMAFDEVRAPGAFCGPARVRVGVAGSSSLGGEYDVEIVVRRRGR